MAGNPVYSELVTKKLSPLVYPFSCLILIVLRFRPRPALNPRTPDAQQDKGQAGGYQCEWPIDGTQADSHQENATQSQ
jgi:hypothetical protein